MKQLREGFSLHFVVAEPHQSNCEQYEVKWVLVAGVRRVYVAQAKST